MTTVSEPSILVIVPTFNERASLPTLIDQLRAQQVALLVVDDNSPDGTGQYVRERATHDSAIHILIRPSKQGLGSAYRAGFVWALARQYRIIVQMDADGSHDAAALPSLLEGIHTADVIIGSRYVAGGSVSHWSFFRRLVSRLGNWYINMILRSKNAGYGIRDSTSGYKVWRREALEAIAPNEMRSDGYAFQIETSWAAAQHGLKTHEMPITFRDRNAGSSKIGRSNIIDTLLLPWRLQ